MKIYGHDLSGHSHRVRLLASLLGLDVEFVAVDLLAGAHKQPEFLAKNPFGQVPVLEDGDVVLADSNAIAVYLAAKYDSSGRWLPSDPQHAAEVQVWLSKAANELANGVAAARLVTVFGANLDHEATQQKGRAFLALVDEALSTREWLVGDAPTLADVALYSYVSAAPEGGIDLRPFAKVVEWLRRIEVLPGFLAFAETETDAKQALAA